MMCVRGRVRIDVDNAQALVAVLELLAQVLHLPHELLVLLLELADAHRRRGKRGDLIW